MKNLFKHLPLSLLITSLSCCAMAAAQSQQELESGTESEIVYKDLFIIPSAKILSEVKQSIAARKYINRIDTNLLKNVEPYGNKYKLKIESTIMHVSTLATTIEGSETFILDDKIEFLKKTITMRTALMGL